MPSRIDILRSLNFWSRARQSGQPCWLPSETTKIFKPKLRATMAWLPAGGRKFAGWGMLGDGPGDPLQPEPARGAVRPAWRRLDARLRRRPLPDLRPASLPRLPELRVPDALPS